MTLDLGTLERQLVAKPVGHAGTGLTDYLLLHPGRKPVRVGRYRHYDRTLEKLHEPDRHAHRLRRGTGLNLELVATLDKVRPQPARVALIIATTAPAGEGERTLPWATVVRYAEAALAGDRRFLLDEDVDRQVLIPYTAWNRLEGPAADVRQYPGGWAPPGHRWADGPPPLPAPARNGHTRPDTPASPTLFDL